MITFLLVKLIMPLWTLIPFGILWLIAYVTKPVEKTEEDYWKQDGYYRNELGIWEKK